MGFAYYGEHFISYISSSTIKFLKPNFPIDQDYVIAFKKFSVNIGWCMSQRKMEDKIEHLRFYLGDSTSHCTTMIDFLDTSFLKIMDSKSGVNRKLQKCKWKYKHWWNELNVKNFIASISYLHKIWTSPTPWLHVY